MRTKRIVLSAKTSKEFYELMRRRGLANMDNDLNRLLSKFATWFVEQNDPIKVRVENWRYMASNPYRTDKDDEWLKTELEALKLIGIEPKYQPVARRKFQRNKS